MDFLCSLCYSSYMTRVVREERMGFPTKVQLIKRRNSQQWYVNFPSAIAQAMEFARGEIVEWIIEDRAQLVLRRRQAPPSALKKTVAD